jgi:predicted GNAT superfamily acetyltransferase
MPDEIAIRRAEGPADYRACQDAQRQAWGLADESYVVPVATMVGAQLHGGLVLGAFLPDGRAVGVSFAFLGRIGGRVGLYSQLTGVIPGYQDRGLGGRLKSAQREIARAEGCEVIAWAFDPLQAGNAYFNLHRLGARGTRYIDDMYGPRTDALNRGVPTDRLIVEWETTPRERVQRQPEPTPVLLGSGPPPLLVGDGTTPVMNTDVLSQDLAGTFLEIPGDIVALRSGDPASAERWRLAVREAFLAAFAAGYQAVDFWRLEAGFDGQRRTLFAYELRRG